MPITREQAIAELRRREAVKELERRGLPVPSATPEQPQEKLGFLDYLMGTGELLGTMATGAIAEPLSGLAGMVASTVPTEPGRAGEVVEKAQEQFTYTPKTAGGKAVAQKVGETIQPVVQAGEKAVRAVGEAGYELGGPTGGAGAITLLAAIPELMGLKGTRTVKKAMLRKIVPQGEKRILYDELGNLLPQIKESLDKAGINMEEVKDVLPETIPEPMVETAREIRKVAKPGVIPSEQKYKQIIEEVKPSQEVIDAYTDLGLQTQMIPSIVSQNPTYVAIEQGLKSIPGSQLAAREKLLVTELSQKADDLIKEFGGTTDKAALSDTFRQQSRDLIGGLETQADELYKRVEEKIPKKLPVKADKTVGLIKEIADELGGVEQLGPKERSLLKRLDPGTNPTYARLDLIRKQIGSALRKNTGPLKDADEGLLKRLYGALAEDQMAAAKSQGAGTLYEVASHTVAQRKAIEKQLTQALGKELTGNITTKAKSAMLGLQKGETKAFDDLLASIPSELDKDTRKSIIASSLNDAFTQGARTERALSVPAFDDFMKGIKRSPTAYARLQSQLGPDAMKRLETFHTVVGAVRKAQTYAISTGRIAAVPGMFDEVSNIATRVYGKAKKAAQAIPGVRVAGAIADIISTEKTPRSMAADSLLANPKLQELILRKAQGKLDTVEKIDRAEELIDKLKDYQDWKKTLDKPGKAELASLGAIGYLMGGITQPKEEDEKE